MRKKAIKNDEDLILAQSALKVEAVKNTTYWTSSIDSTITRSVFRVDSLLLHAVDRASDCEISSTKSMFW